MKRLLLPAAFALALASTSSAQCGDDSFEDNDTCGTPAPMPLGLTTGLVVYRQNTDPDFFEISVPNNFTINIDALFSHAAGDIDIKLRDATCGVQYDSGGSASDNENVSWNNQTGAAETVSLEVYVWNQSPATCNTYDLDVTLTPSIVCGVDDMFEDNDFCGMHAQVATPFIQQNLYVEIGDADFYEFTLPDQMQLDVACLFTHAIADIDVFVYDVNVSCANNTQFLAAGQSASNNEILSYANASGGPLTIAVKCEVWGGSQGFCNSYDLDLTLGPIAGACAGAPDDGFEENDDCASAAPISSGSFPGLKVTLTDPDFYVFDVQPGATLTVDVTFLHLDADIELYLYDPVTGCGGQGSANVASSTSGTNNESIVWTNNTGAAVTLTLEVTIYVFSAGSCAYYDLDLTGATPSVVGTNYCGPAVANSTGASATIRATGSSAVGDNDVTLIAEDLPASAFGFFLTSRMQGTIAQPGGSQGVLCLSGAIGRYVGPGQIQNSGAAGAFDLTIDLTQVPTPTGLVAATAGETWNFTAWFRDAVGGSATSNFTDGYSITFI